MNKLKRMVFLRIILFGVTITICIDVVENTDTHYEKNEMAWAYSIYRGENRCSVLVGKPA